MKAYHSLVGVPWSDTLKQNSAVKTSTPIVTETPLSTPLYSADIVYTGEICSDVPWLDCPACVQCFNMRHNGHEINLYGVVIHDPYLKLTFR